MKNSNWKYKIGTDLFAFVPLSISLLIFGGVSIWLYTEKNGAVLFTGFLTAILIICAIYNIYRVLFVKILIGEDGFYHKAGISGGKYYKYSDIAEAWQSNGKTINGTVSYYLNYKTSDGKTVKFQFLPFQDEGIEYLLEKINGKGEDAANEE